MAKRCDLTDQPSAATLNPPVNRLQDEPPRVAR